jgi:PTH1 family peptidyl-tRNA hydrolase
MSYRLIVGLGNPGEEYERTRHNVGFRVIESYAAARGGADWTKQRNLKGDLSQVVFEGSKVYLLKPRTYMNESGVSIQKACSYYKIPPEELLVIYDDITLDVGAVKASERGGTGGHNGLADIVSRIKPSFTRLRIGVGQKPHKEMDLADYVLGRFNPEDENLISASMERYFDCLDRLLRDGPEKAMIHINRKTKQKDREDGQL